MSYYATYLIGCATLAAIPLQIIWVNKGLMYFEVRDAMRGAVRGAVRAGGSLARALAARASIRPASHLAPPPHRR